MATSDREVVLSAETADLIRGIAVSLLHRPEDWVTTYSRGRDTHNTYLVEFTHKKAQITICQTMSKYKYNYYDTTVFCELLTLRIPDNGRHPVISLLEEGIKLVRAPEEERLIEQEVKKKEQQRLENEEKRRKFFEALGVA